MPVHAFKINGTFRIYKDDSNNRQTKTRGAIANVTCEAKATSYKDKQSRVRPNQLESRDFAEWQ